MKRALQRVKRESANVWQSKGAYVAENSNQTSLEGAQVSFREVVGDKAPIVGWAQKPLKIRVQTLSSNIRMLLKLF